MLVQIFNYIRSETKFRFHPFDPLTFKMLLFCLKLLRIRYVRKMTAFFYFLNYILKKYLITKKMVDFISLPDSNSIKKNVLKMEKN